MLRSQLNLARNEIGGYWDSEQQKVISTPEGPKAIVDALLVHASLTALDVRINRLGDEGEALLRQTVQGRSRFDLNI